MSAMEEMPESQGQIYDLQTQLNAVRSAVSVPSLNLRQINKLSDKVATLCQKVTKIQEVATRNFTSPDLLQQGMQLIETLEEKRDDIRLKDSKILKKIHIIDFEIEKLRDEILLLTSEEAFLKLAEYYDRLKSLQEKREVSPRIEKAIFLTLEHLAEVDFALKFPIYLELLEDSYQENYIQRLRDVSQRFYRGEKGALLSFLTLSDRQREEIHHAFARRKGESLKEGKRLFHSPDASAKDRSLAIEDHLAELCAFCHLAKTSLYQERERALIFYEQLPFDVKERLHEIIWAASGKNEEEFLAQEGPLGDLLAPILMQLVEEKMLG